MSPGEILRNALRAKAQTGRGVIPQFVDMARLRVSNHGVRPDYYFLYRLFDPKLSWEDRSRFVGPWAKHRIYRIQDAETARLCSDKLRSYKLFDDLGLPYPRVIAVTHPAIEFPGVVPLRSVDEVVRWLGEASYPFFMKPSVSYLGYGNKLVDARDGERIKFRNGEETTVKALADLHGPPGRPTMLFQELIRPHPDLAAHIGDHVATARIVVLNDGPEPEVIAAGLRIPRGNSMTDNFQSGRSGNLMAFIDLETGRITTVLTGLGFEWNEIETHPDTRRKLVGFALPDWTQAMSLVDTASRALPGLRIHGWDVAFSDRGPLLVETNPRGDLNLAQIGRGRGLADTRFLRMYPGGKL